MTPEAVKKSGEKKLSGTEKPDKRFFQDFFTASFILQSLLFQLLFVFLPCIMKKQHSL